MENVKIWEDKVTIPTCEVGATDRNKLDQALVKNSHNVKARALKAVILRKPGRMDAAMAVIKDNLGEGRLEGTKDNRKCKRLIWFWTAQSHHAPIHDGFEISHRRKPVRNNEYGLPVLSAHSLFFLRNRIKRLITCLYITLERTEINLTK